MNSEDQCVSRCCWHPKRCREGNWCAPSGGQLDTTSLKSLTLTAQLLGIIQRKSSGKTVKAGQGCASLRKDAHRRAVTLLQNARYHQEEFMEWRTAELESNSTYAAIPSLRVDLFHLRCVISTYQVCRIDTLSLQVAKDLEGDRSTRCRVWEFGL